MTEPGLYWARYVGGNIDNIVRVTEVQTVQQLKASLIGNPISCVKLGPRIPSAKEIEEWVEDPLCPDCGESLEHDFDSTDDYGWFCPKCKHRARNFTIETRYRVKSE